MYPKSPSSLELKLGTLFLKERKKRKENINQSVIQLLSNPDL